MKNRDTRWITSSIKIFSDLKTDYYLFNKQYNKQILNYRYEFIYQILKKKT
jgi:hypothetical protein